MYHGVTRQTAFFKPNLRQGKNPMVYHKKVARWIFLGARVSPERVYVSLLQTVCQTFVSTTWSSRNKEFEAWSLRINICRLLGTNRNSIEGLGWQSEAEVGEYQAQKTGFLWLYDCEIIWLSYLMIMWLYKVLKYMLVIKHAWLWNLRNQSLARNDWLLNLVINHFPEMIDYLTW